MLTSLVLPWAIGALALALCLNLWRLLRGPDLADRVLALDTMYVDSIAALILLGMAWRTPWYFEAALVVAALGFVGTVVLSKFIAQGDVGQ
jgi:multicomponent K+:H+ antiporter subunit F